MSLDEAVVLAGGEGKRMRPVTANRPKPMLPATTYPILRYVLDALVDSGVDRFVAVVGYKRDRVRDYFGPTYRDRPIEYVIQQKQLGSGHALLQARDAVGGQFLLVNGDQIVVPEMVADVSEEFGNDPAAARLAVAGRDDVSRYGAVELRDDRVTDIVEKPTGGEYHLVNAGVYAFDKSIFSTVEGTRRVDGELSLTDAIGDLVDARNVAAVRTDGLWIDATYPWDLLSVTERLLDAGWVDLPERDPDVWVDESARVPPSAVLVPPVAVGADASVGPNAVVGPCAAVGRTATVGAGSVVRRTLLEDDARVGPGATLVDCVVCQGAVVGAGSTVPGGPGDVRIGTTVHEDRRLGALLADRVRVGGDVSFAPGTLVGPGATVDDGAAVSGTVPGGAEVRR